MKCHALAAAVAPALVLVALQSAAQEVRINKSVNGDPANTAPGPILTVGDPVTWTYEVINGGDITLLDIAVTDDRGVAVTCPGDTLLGGESMTCTASGLVIPGLYMNVGTVSAFPDGGEEPIEASDVAYYFGAGAPGTLDLEKLTNGVDADTPPGPSVFFGAPVAWSYVVTNNAGETVDTISVTDDHGVVITCPATTLAAGESMTCTASGTAQAGQYVNIAEVIGYRPSGEQLRDMDLSHYFGLLIDIEKFTNGLDVTAPPGPSISQGVPVLWTYQVTNVGGLDIFDITVEDSDPALVVTCPGNALAPGASMVCSASGVATVGQYANTATAAGTAAEDIDASDTDTSYYLGTEAIALEKRVEGVEADTPPGPSLPAGTVVTWTYVVTNLGSVDLDTIVVTDDDPALTVTCPGTTLAPGASMTCTATGVAVEGPYVNIGSVTANTPSGVIVATSDPSHYLGVSAAVPWLGAGGLAALALLLALAGLAALRC